MEKNIEVFKKKSQILVFLAQFQKYSKFGQCQTKEDDTLWKLAISRWKALAGYITLMVFFVGVMV